MEDADDVHGTVRLRQVCDPVVSVKQNSNVAIGILIALPDLWKALQNLCSLKDSLDRLCCRRRTVSGNVFEDIFEPALSLERPDYLRQERMRRAISLLGMTRPASESASPFCTITWNASSRTISSRELSAG
jgi:hypothetical protein